MTLVVTRPEANRAEWLAWRRGGIGASDVAALAGVSRWTTPAALYLEKTGQLGEPLDDIDDDDFWWAHEQEDDIARAVERRAGLHVIGAQAWCQHPKFPHHRCTVDGFLGESPHSAIGDAVAVLEEKTETHGSVWRSAGVDEIPLDCEYQGQWQMHVTGLDRVLFAASLFGRFPLMRWLERDQQVIDGLVRLAERFWACVLGGTPPPVDGHDATTAALKAAFPDVGHLEPVELDQLADVIDLRQRIKAEFEAAKERLASIDNELRLAIGDHSAGTVAGEIAVAYPVINRKGYWVEATTYRRLDVKDPAKRKAAADA